MSAVTPAETQDKLRAAIGRKVKALRSARSWSQTELATRLGLSQSRLSHVENGTASLSAEQFLELLRIFNVPASEFSPHLRIDRLSELQNALARLGASHLLVSDAVAPTERLSPVEQVLLETSTTNDARLLTAIGPVIVTHELSNIAWVLVEAHKVGRAQRLYWILENLLEALNSELPDAGRHRPAYRRAARIVEATLAASRGYESQIVVSPDILDASLREDNDDARLSPLAKKWRVITTLQPADFARALREAREADQRLLPRDR